MTNESANQHDAPRAGTSADSGFAMLTVLLLIMICAGLSILMLGALMAQVKPTMFEMKNTRTIGAAETGIDATLSQLRNANSPPDLSGKVYGDPTKLPCTVSGTVGGSTSTTTYAVTISYYDESPASHDTTWRTTNALTCTPGSGVVMTPAFALITSVGSDVAVAGYTANVGDRTLESVYTFKVSNAPTTGGTIYSYGDTYCLKAMGGIVGSAVSYVPASLCQDDDPATLWTYGTDYGIHLAVTDITSTPLCITGRGGIAVTLTKCVGGYDQMFSWEGGARWRGQNTTNTNYSSECLGTGDSTLTVLTGKPLKITTACADKAAYGAFDPDARVGAGAAGESTHQVVNFLEFGRCFDVTGTVITAPAMIVYPCKQDPSGGTHLEWNHKWTYTEPTGPAGTKTGTITVNNGSTYCLTTPLVSSGSPYPQLFACDGSTRQNWTRTAKAGSYADSWTFKDSSSPGRCITLGDKYETYWSKMVVAPCDGTAAQKWNAPANAQSASLDGFKELN